MNEKNLKELLRSALPPAARQGPARDLWPAIVQRIESPPSWSWLDIGILTAATIGILAFPSSLVLMALNL